MDEEAIQCLRKQGNIFGLPEDPSLVPDRGLGEIYFDKMKENAENIAQIDAASGKKETYAQVLSRAIRVAQGLKAKGITEDDVVALCTFNSMESAIPILSCLFLNVKSVNLDPRIPLNDVIPLLNQVKPKIIFCQPDVTLVMDEAITISGLNCEIVVFGDTQTHTPYSEYLISRGPEDEFHPVPMKSVYDVVLMHFSSGTTSTPKAVCCRHFGLYYGCKFLLENMKPIETIIVFTSPYWVSGCLIIFWSIMTGKPRVLCANFNPQNACKYIQDYTANTTVFATVIVNMMTKHPELCDFDVSSMQNIMIGGSALTPDTCRKFMKLFPNATMQLCYGMTEMTSPVFRTNDITEEKLNKKTVSVGTPLPGLTYKVVDIDTEEILGPNQIGELRIKYKGIFASYYNEPKMYADVFDSDGFYKTGDTLYYDENYEFYVVDRIKEMFKYKGWQISPSSIESVLLTHPDVAECVVVGIPADNIGEIPTGVVVLKNGKQTQTEELLEYVNARVNPRFVLDGGVHIVDSLPHSTTGKIQSRIVRETLMKVMKTKD